MARPRVLANPASGRGRGARLGRLLRGRSDLDVRAPDDAAGLRREARRAVDDGCPALFVAGGDGTLHHAIRELAGSPCALGILPCGSGNDLARALGLPLDARQALERQLAAAPRRIDLGRAGGVPFAGVAGLGLDGEVALRAARVRRFRGPWIYPWAILSALGRFQPPGLVVEHEGGRIEGRCWLVALANSPRFGGGMRIAPGALLDDGLLDLVLVERLTRRRLLAALPSLYTGDDRPRPGVVRRRVRRVRVAADRPLTCWGDGEPLLAVPPAGTTIEVWPGALGVLA